MALAGFLYTHPHLCPTTNSLAQGEIRSPMTTQKRRGGGTFDTHYPPIPPPAHHIYRTHRRHLQKKTPTAKPARPAQTLGHKKGGVPPSLKITVRHHHHTTYNRIFCPSLPKVYICARASEQPRTSLTPTNDANFVGALLHACTVTVPLASSTEILPAIPNAASA